MPINHWDFSTDDRKTILRLHLGRILILRSENEFMECCGRDVAIFPEVNSRQSCYVLDHTCLRMAYLKPTSVRMRCLGAG